nr:MAG TPA: hypothetical protein [Caudoviricetes sp.]
MGNVWQNVWPKPFLTSNRPFVGKNRPFVGNQPETLTLVKF